jgi:uncharacterized protein
VTGPRTCPICGKPAGADTRPFCSRRCADIDLARWLGDGYRIPGEAAPDEPEPPSGPSGAGKPH